MANTKITAANIDSTSTGFTLADLTVNGDITGTLATAAQPNITSVGTLTGLDVAGTPTFDGLTVDGTADISSNITVGTLDTIIAENNIRFKPTGAVYIDHNTVGQDINFRVSNASSLDTTPLTIKSSGNVGISVTSPSEKLEVDGGLKISNSNSRLYFGTEGGTSYRALEGNTSGSLLQVGEGYTDIVLQGNVGIGETSPDNILHIKTTASGGPQIQMGDGTNYSFINFDGTSLQLSTQRDMVDGTWYNTSKSWGGINIKGNTDGSEITMQTAGNSNTSPSTRFIIDKDGHVIIGGNYAQAGQLSVYTASTNDPALYGYRSTSDFKIIPFLSNGAFSGLSSVNDSGLFFSDGFVIAKHSAGNIGMYISSNGSVNIGTKTEATGSTGGATFSVDSSNRRNLICATTGTGTLELIEFRNPNGTVGTIKTSGSSTSYNTSSDYRLKENVTYDFNALDRIAQLKPARFNFIADADTTVDGFLAHEVQDIVPEAIHGEKDATKEEEYEVTPAEYEDDGETLISEAVIGTRTVPVYQDIDQSKLVPLLTKAIQEQQTIIDDLKSRIEALEG